MAQYFTDISDSPTLTERWNTADYDATIQTSGIPSGGGTHALRILRTGSQSRFAVSWDNPGTSISGDVEVLAMVQHEHTSNTTNLMGPALYGAGTAGSESAYFTRLITSSLGQSIVKYVSGGSTSVLDSGLVTVNRNVWYRVRIQRTGTTIRTRIWQDGSGEPGTWDVSRTDSDLSSGWTGIWAAFSAGTVWCAWIGVGTGGDAAPDAPVTTGTGNLANIDLETGDLSQFDPSPFGPPTVSSTTPIQGTYSMLTTSNAHATKTFSPVNAVYFMQEIKYTTYPAGGTRNIAALRYSSGELISLRVTTSGELRLQLGGSTLYTAPSAVGTDPVAVMIYADRAAGLIELWTWNMLTDNAWTVVYTATGHSISNDFEAIRVGGLNGSHEGTHRTDYIQVGTNSDIVPHTYVPPAAGLPAMLMRRLHYGPRGLTGQGGPF